MSTPRTVRVTVSFYANVEPVDPEQDDDGDDIPLDANQACSAADLATWESLGFSNAIQGAHIAESAVDTTVHVDGFGKCLVSWPDLNDLEISTEDAS